MKRWCIVLVLAFGLVGLCTAGRLIGRNAYGVRGTAAITLPWTPPLEANAINFTDFSSNLLCNVNDGTPSHNYFTNNISFSGTNNCYYQLFLTEAAALTAAPWITRLASGNDVLDFKGDTKQIRMPQGYPPYASPGYGDGNFSVGFWTLLRTNVNSTVWIRDLTGKMYMQYRSSGTKLVLYITGDNNGASFALNTWAHLAITYSNGTTRVYRNGALEITSTQNPRLAAIDRMHLNRGITERWNGQVDDFCVATSVWSTAIISNFVNRGAPDTRSGP